jgi:guanosine-3',5'-bis(diphosphate) 3'-pyrophosphohydrolase
LRLADKIANLRDIDRTPPHDWSLERKRDYFDRARSVVDGLRGTHATLAQLFEAAYARRP